MPEPRGRLFLPSVTTAASQLFSPTHVSYYWGIILFRGKSYNLQFALIRFWPLTDAGQLYYIVL